MLYQKTELLTFNTNSEEAIEFVINRLRRAGLHVIQSFDFRKTRTAQNDFKCSLHQNAFCDCQLAVLLVYDLEVPLATLVVSGHNLNTTVSFVESPPQIGSQEIKKKLFNTLMTG